MQQRIQFSATINGQKTGPHELPKDLMMIEFLQEYAGMNGTRLGCGQGVCRACTIIVDEPGKGPHTVPACVTGVAWLNGKSMRTIEGAAHTLARSRPLPCKKHSSSISRSSAAIARRAL